MGRSPLKISAEKLAVEAEKTGFRPEILEKVAHLLGLLTAFQNHPFLKGKLALKGGTALNLFVFNVPRLSVDIDLNYVGAEDREVMLAERPKIEQAIQAVFSREGYIVRRMPDEHAGGKWSLRYDSSTGQRGNLEVDLNFMFRVPLWPLILSNSHRVGSWHATDIPVLDTHELAAGKLAALLARKQARDVFDGREILNLNTLDSQKLRIGFVVYGAMNRKDWRTVDAEDVYFSDNDLASMLIPTLRANHSNGQLKFENYGTNLVKECRDGLSAVLPFTDSEMEFLNLLLDKGIINPTLLTNDVALQSRILSQPLLQWKVINVKHFRGL